MLTQRASPVRDLNRHETRGHTIGRHISVSPTVLRQRIANEGTRAASSFWDICIAKACINYAVVSEFDQITTWFFTSMNRRFPLHVTTPCRTSIGYGVMADDARLRFLADVTVVLERVGATFYVVTAYPRVL